MAVIKGYILTDIKEKMRADKTKFYTFSAITSESLLVSGSTKDPEIFNYLHIGEYVIIMGCRSSPRGDGSIFMELLPETKVIDIFVRRGAYKSYRCCKVVFSRIYNAVINTYLNVSMFDVIRVEG